MSLFFFVLSRCHFFFFFFISLFLSLFCPPNPIRGETILLALCHFSFLFYQGVTSSFSLSLYFSLCFVRPAQFVEKQFCLLYVTFHFCFIKVSDDRYRGVLGGMCWFNFSLLLHMTISLLHFDVHFDKKSTSTVPVLKRNWFLWSQSCHTAKELGIYCYCFRKLLETIQNSYVD